VSVSNDGNIPVKVHIVVGTLALATRR
jgi:hypothetical protein